MLTYENTKVRISTENLVKTHISTKKCNLERGRGKYRRLKAMFFEKFELTLKTKIRNS